MLSYAWLCLRDVMVSLDTTSLLEKYLSHVVIDANGLID
jgi:hypothetical protein